MKTIFIALIAALAIGIAVPAIAAEDQAAVEIVMARHVAVCEASRGVFQELGYTIVDDCHSAVNGSFTLKNADGRTIKVSNDEFKSWTYTTVRADNKEEARKIAAAIASKF